MNNDFELPDLKENDENVDTEHNQNKIQEKIEIPQEYYDKIEKEKQERLAKQEEKEKQEEAVSGSGNMFFLILINALVIFALLFAMVNYNHYILFAIPIYVVIGTISSCKSKGKESNFNVSILVGGMISAVICFIVTMLNKDLADTYSYFAFASFVVAFLGYALSSIITKIMTDKENVKALQTIFFVLIIVAMIGVPYYFYSTKKDEFMKLVFNMSDMEAANTEEGYIIGVLKNRYKKDVTCDAVSSTSRFDATSYLVKERICYIDETKFVVSSITYNESDNLHIVGDGYLDELYINDFKNDLIKKINSFSSAKEVKISLYPDNKCFFVGECEANDKYDKELDIENLYNYSKDLKLDEYLNLTKEEFINKYKFKVIISIKGDYGGYNEDTLKEMVDNTLNLLNEGKYKNTKGYEISIKDSKSYSTVYKATGKATSDQTFSNPKYEIID